MKPGYKIPASYTLNEQVRISRQRYTVEAVEKMLVRLREMRERIEPQSPKMHRPKVSA